MSSGKYEQLTEDDVKSLRPEVKNTADAAASSDVSALAAAIAGRSDVGDVKRPPVTALPPTVAAETNRLLEPTRTAPVSIVRNLPSAPPAAAPPPVPKRRLGSAESTLTVRKACLGMFATVAVVVALALVMMRGDTASNEQDSAAMTLDFRAMCDSKAPFSFATRDLRNNRTLVYFIEGDVEVVDVMQSGEVMYTESIDFAAKIAILFPKGRSLIQRRPCTVQEITKERSWRAVVCTELSTQESDRLVLDDRQMAMIELPVIMKAVPANFFDAKPQDCAGTSAPLQEDATQNADDVQVARFRNMTSDHTLRPAMLADVLTLLSKEHGGDYAQSDSLQTSLAAAFDRSQAAYMNASMWTRAPAPANSSADLDICCGLNPHCRTVMSSHRTALPILCSGYASCVRSHGERRDAGMRHCIDHQQSCECSIDFSAHLLQPGTSLCGDCKTDPQACDCYAALWLQSWALSHRTCSCQGVCVRARFPFVCDTSKSCSGWWDPKCETTVHWCVRPEVYPCFRCNMLPRQQSPRAEADASLLCHVDGV